MALRLWASSMRFVYAHNHHRRNVENSGNVRDNMKGGIRFMTAITLAYAHAYQSICLTKALACEFVSILPPAQNPGRGIPTFPMFAPQHVRGAVTFWMGYLYRRRKTQRERRNLCWMERHRRVSKRVPLSLTTLILHFLEPGSLLTTLLK